MKNLHILKTKKPSRLRYYNNSEYILSKGNLLWADSKNIYITSDEEIKKGDWIFSIKTNNLFKADSIEFLESHNMIEDFDKSFYINSKYAKKIILTTDPKLIADGVQPIDDEFLEWFVKNPSCEWVEAKLIEEIPSGFTFGMFGNDEPPTELVYKIIIPKEEPKQEWNPTQGEEVWIKVFSNWSKGIYIGYDVTKETHIVREDDEGGGHLMSSSQVLPYCEMPNKPKQETLEEAAKDFANNSAVTNYEEGINVGKYQGFIRGAKWQQERSYSEEEVLAMLNNYNNHIQENFDPSKTILPIKEWFEQFKKK